jgi:hypothetical protein
MPPAPVIHFHFDPVCPFAWLTSRWVRDVAAQRSYDVDWRFVSLRILNEHVDYDSHFPPEYEQGHTAGLRMLRVCAAARERHGRQVMDGLYTALGGSVFDVDPPSDPAAYRDGMGHPDTVGPLLAGLGLDADLVKALDDDEWDGIVRAETEEALAKSGRDVGTPIIAYDPPHGPAFFGPVISRVPEGEEALRLWDAVIELTSFAGFSELKRSLRERPSLRVLGLAPDQLGQEEDWHEGSRRLKR